MDASSDCWWDGGSQNSEAHRQELAATKDVGGTRQGLTQQHLLERSQFLIRCCCGHDDIAAGA